MSESQIFANALKHATPEARAAYLDGACAGDPGLRAAVEALLRADAVGGADFLERPAVPVGGETGPAMSGGEPPSPAGAGQVLAGRYKLLEEIGEGGMGTVWMAQQTEPVKRLVAVKLVRAGMDSRPVLARFEAERQALALMDHPNIAKVHDAGTTPDGRPFFVMELVKGVPITIFCDDHHLTPRQRLELLVEVCSALQHAHQKGVIHRDLKPNNVLVALYDDRPVPKVIDFGVAKATGPQLTERTLHTGFGAVVGTVEYMSPEQAGFNQLDVDTRSDVYSLGVLLYELLAGSPPFSRKELGTAGLLEMLRVIREQEPSKPSAKLSTAEGLPTLAANRGTEPAKLTRLVRGELDWIVMKALEKNRGQRYETANGLARDLQRFLADEVVEARPPGAGYRLRKFVKRNRGPVAAASLTTLLLLGGVAGTTAGLVTARQQRDAADRARLDEAREAARAVAAEKLASNRLAQVEAEKQRAEEERAVAQAVNEFVRKDLLGQADVDNQLGGPGADGSRTSEIKVRTVVDRAAKVIGGRFANRPKVEAAIRLTIAQAYLALGQFKDARFHTERSLALRTEHLGPDHRDTLRSKDFLGWVCQHEGFKDRALAIWEGVLASRMATLGPDDLDTLTSKHQVGFLYHDRREFDRAEPLLLEALRGREAQLGVDHTDTLETKSFVAWLNYDRGKKDLATTQFAEILEAFERKLGEDHPGARVAMTNLGLVYQERGNFASAESLFQRALKRSIELYGPNHSWTLDSKLFLADLYYDQLKYAEAASLLKEIVEASGHGDAWRVSVASLGGLARVYMTMDKPLEAVPIIEQRLKKLSERPAMDDSKRTQTTNARFQLVRAHVAAKQFDRGIALAEEVLTQRKDQFGTDDPLTLEAMWVLAWALLEAEQPAKALEHIKVYIDHQRKRQGAASLPFAQSQSKVSASLLKHKQYAEAEQYLRECLAVREKQEPDAWTTFDTQSRLGAAIACQKKYDEAAPLLLRGYEGLKQREDRILPQSRSRLTEALERLVQLYDAMNKPDEAAKWRKVLEDRKKKP